METIFMNTENSKTNEPHKFVLNFKFKIEEILMNMVALQKWSMYYTWKNIRKQYKSNKLEIVAPTWFDEFEMRDGSYSVANIQGYIEYIRKKHERLTTIPPIRVYINKIINRLVFEIKDGYKLELRSLETMKLFGRTKK